VESLLETEIEIKGFKHQFRTLYAILSVLGVGAFGVVIEARNRHSGEVIALKIVTQENSK